MRHVNEVMRDMFGNCKQTPQQRHEARMAARNKHMPVIRRILDIEPQRKAEQRRVG